MVTVDYHVQHDGRYHSLQYVHDTRAEAESDSNDRSESTIIRPIELDHEFFGVYTATEVLQGTTADADMSEYSADTMAIVDTILALFDVIEEEQAIQWYKPLEEDSIADAIEHIQWKKPAVDVGGQLVSSLILAHGLPNANHRTAVAFLNLYLDTIESLPSAPQTNVGDDWSEWANDFIRESKRLTTLRRKFNLFRYLSENGATVIQRKNQVNIQLTNYDLSLSDQWSHYGTLHQDASIEFVREYVDRAGVPELSERYDPGKRTLASRL